MHNKSGNSYNQETLMVRMPGGKIISNSSAIDTFIAVISHFGYEKVVSTGMLHHNKYPIVARENISGKYKEATLGWFVLSDCYNKLKAIYINDLADIFDESIVAEMIAK